MSSTPDDLPTVVREAELKVGTLTIRVHHLSDGQRLIPVDDFQRFIDWISDPAHIKDVTPSFVAEIEGVTGLRKEASDGE